METNKTSSPGIASRLRRHRGTPKSSINANAAPPALGHSSRILCCAAVVAAVVLIVSVEVCAVFPLIVTEGGARLQVTGSLAAVGLIEQLKLTVPVNPFDGVTEIVAVFPVVAPGSIFIVPLPPLPLKVGAPLTVKLC
jgi:hypothetical protein